MKKITILTMAMVFALTFGVAYAWEGGKKLNNGITDFSGRSYDIGPVATVPALVAPMEGSHAGGLRSSASEMALNNGVTDFSGKTYETPNIDLAAIEPSVEGAHAGGMRDEGPGKLFNGVTDFNGRTYDIE